jgi:hypothetical protein
MIKHLKEIQREIIRLIILLDSFGFFWKLLGLCNLPVYPVSPWVLPLIREVFEKSLKGIAFTLLKDI